MPTRLQVAFITVDPAQDTPELMKTYLSSFDPRIVGLTGTEDEIAAAAKAYKIYYRKVPTDSGYTMDHSATLFLMDGKGDFYGTSNFQEPEEITALQAEAVDQERVMFVSVIPGLRSRTRDRLMNVAQVHSPPLWGRVGEGGCWRHNASERLALTPSSLALPHKE